MASEQKHSAFGGSAAYRWLACGPSVRECAKAPRKEPSPYAEKGTFAHRFAAYLLKEVGPANGPVATGFIGETFDEDGEPFTVTTEMAKSVQVYLDDIHQFVERDDEWYVEQKFSLHGISNQLWGHNDFSLYKPKTRHLMLWDFKDGAGIFVPAEGNAQLAYYLVGAFQQHFSSYAIDKITLTIVQPNYDASDGPVRRWELTGADLFDWIEIIRVGYRNACDPIAPYVPGPKQCRFCVGCDHMYMAVLTGFMEDPQAGDMRPADVSTMPSEELGRRLKEVELIETWCKLIRERAYAEAVAGNPPAGWKLVAKRATRKWISEETVADAIFDRFPHLLPRDITKTEVLSPAQLEKVIGKASMPALSDLISKQSSGTTLVPESNDRPAVASGVAADFGDVPTGE